MANPYDITFERKKQYVGLYVLATMQAGEESFRRELVGSQKLLAPVFSWLLEQGYVLLSTNDHYGLTPKGQEVVEQFSARYQRFLKDYDIYSAVDLEAGEFAFRYYHDFPDQQAWQNFLADERWDDLRVAVAEYKSWDVIEIIFMSLVSEGCFGHNEDGEWDEDLLFGSVWEEISRLAQSAIKMNSLAYVHEGELVAAEEVLEDILAQGQEVLAQLHLS